MFACFLAANPQVYHFMSCLCYYFYCSHFALPSVSSAHSVVHSFPLRTIMMYSQLHLQHSSWIHLSMMFLLFLLDILEFPILPIATLYLDGPGRQPRLIHFSYRASTFHGFHERHESIPLGHARLLFANNFHHLQTRVFGEVFVQLLIRHVLGDVADE